MGASKDSSNEFVMVGGDGADSYSQNSSYQGGLLDATRERFNQVISTSLDLNNPSFDLSSKAFTIADYGCATGPNTFFAVQNIIQAVKAKIGEETAETNTEFVVYFNDHSGNDFNTLFKSLPPNREYFAVGVPGSFYDQVLPSNSLHIGTCNYTLHLLSSVPKGIESPDSPAFNKDIYCSGLHQDVFQAYLGQFMTDMDTFLNARAKEVVPGGLLLLLGPCLPDGLVMSETVMGKNLSLMGSCIDEMAKSEKIDRSKADSFNLPFYFAHVSEYKQVIDKNAKFAIETIERVRHDNEAIPLDAGYLKSSFKAAFGGRLAGVFGEEARDEIMENFGKKTTEHLPEFAKAETHMQFFIVLRRN